ncbi:MAG TPA: hypothetical protein VGA96_08225 [Fibrella sp.]
MHEAISTESGQLTAEKQLTGHYFLWTYLSREGLTLTDSGWPHNDPVIL